MDGPKNEDQTYVSVRVEFPVAPRGPYKVPSCGVLGGRLHVHKKKHVPSAVWPAHLLVVKGERERMRIYDVP